MTQPVSSRLPDFDHRAALQLYLAGRQAEASALFLQHWQFLDANTLSRIDARVQARLDAFVLAFLYVFTQADFLIPPEHHLPFVLCNRVVSNIIALTSFRTTDAHLEMIRDQPANYVRLLTLYSARNRLQIDRKAIVEFDPGLASFWYAQYGSLCQSALASEQVRQNLAEHFRFSHPQLKFPHAVQELYFGSTYVDGMCDRPLKTAINAAVRRQAQPQFTNNADRRRIAVLTAAWSPAHSVYRTFLQYIRALRPRYHVTLFQLGGFCPPDPASFDECHELHVFGPKADLARLQNNAFQIAYFPDVGMSLESIVLANCRIAPIQACGVGHSVSTYGTDIDYYMAGADVVRPDEPEQDYSERLVLLPGMGVIHEKPAYRRAMPEFPLPPDPMREAHGEILVNVPAPSQKLNAGYIGTLKKILHQTARPVRFRFYVAASPAAHNDYIAFERALAAELGPEHVQVMPPLAYKDYMASLEEGDLTIDTYHFGGCNSISDSLFLGLPTVTWEGMRWYNRIGSHMLRIAGLEDCVATSEESYIARVVSLIQDAAARAAVKSRVEQADLNGTVYDTKDAQYLAAAFDDLIANHERLKRAPDRSALRIPRS